ncbi:MAG: bifunctional pyr operon transcriptional regulator/uracil phosphoribosyltransferase PyrR [Deltaproteobacteria bacterium]|jgi:pyrimidine operon attenuation protein/uracil phosphoribosyltransferase|nr:bifunctional pyr operon transcriptional regulator/uracil phosphoribosyltransferase PyrR [Deltaproteobacteria bacterium]
MSSQTRLYDADEMAKAMATMAADILALRPEPPVLVGVRRGGVTLANRLAHILTTQSGQTPPIGVLDINLYRDDWTRARALPKVGRTEIRFSLDRRRVVLVDDVLFTGRTTRSALEELNNFGRPRRIELAVLVDRGQREMPIQADFVGFKVEVQDDEVVEVIFAEGGEAQDQVLLLKKAHPKEVASLDD